MWQYIGMLPPTEIASLWGRFRDVPFLFDDESEGRFDLFESKCKQSDTHWYRINDGYIMLSDFKHTPGVAVWHTLVLPNQLTYRDSWEIMLDAFGRFQLRLIVSGVPAYHPRALRAAEKAGFIVTLIKPNAVTRFGKKHAMHYMMIDKEVVCRQLSQSPLLP